MVDVGRQAYEYLIYNQVRCPIHIYGSECTLHINMAASGDFYEGLRGLRPLAKITANLAYLAISKNICNGLAFQSVLTLLQKLRTTTWLLRSFLFGHFYPNKTNHICIFENMDMVATWPHPFHNFPP